MARVCIDVSPAVHGRAGIGRYSGELARALAAHPGGNTLVLFYNRPRDARPDPSLAGLPALKSQLEDRPWRSAVMRSYFPGGALDSMFHGMDIFHATDHVLPRLKKVRTVFTLHDLAYRKVPETFPLLHRLYQGAMMPRFLRAADAILCDSDTTRRDALHAFKLRERRLHVVYPGVDPRFTRAPAAERARVRQELHLPERYLLYVGTLEPRKNLKRLLRAFAAVRQSAGDLRLVIAGRKGWMADDLQRGMGGGSDSGVQFTGFVAEENLPGLYSGAEVFVYPSLYEGFGLPVLEAMACGTPVACSDVGSLREVAGEAALKFPPRDERAMAEVLRRLTADAALRANFSGAGQVRARVFSWERAARETEVVYREVLRASPVASPNYSE